MKTGWKLFLAFYLPNHFAFGSFYVVSWLLDGKVDCRNLCTFSLVKCADSDALMWVDLFAYSGIGLILLSIVLPLLILSRNNEPQPLELFR
jgi:hypothetical protein